MPTRLGPLLVQAIGMHDNPWRASDADPSFNEQTGLPHDFITYPMTAKVGLYRRGLDALEEVHPWLAYMVSRHYTTFSGTRDVDELQEPEAERRERLEPYIAEELLEEADEALAWIKFFDVFSLHLCLTGPHADPDSIPRWLRDPTGWATAPDDTELELVWQDDETLRVGPWPFGERELAVDLYHRRLEDTASDADAMLAAWDDAPIDVRQVTLLPKR